MSPKLQEWAAFIALVPYFYACPGPPRLCTRLRIFLSQCKDPVLLRDDLLLRAGLSFFADDFESDLALMELVRDGSLRPIADCPFLFAISHPKGVERCALSLSNPVAKRW